MYTTFEKRTNPFPPDWSEAPPQTLFAFIRYYCRGFYTPLWIIMIAGIAVAVLEVLLFGFIGNIVDWLAARAPRHPPARRRLETRRHGAGGAGIAATFQLHRYHRA